MNKQSLSKYFKLDRLLDAVSLILNGQPYRYPGSPDWNMPTQILPNTFRDNQMMEQKDQELIVLALDIVGSFNFTGRNFKHIFIPETY